MSTLWQQHWQQQLAERKQQHLLRSVRMFDDKAYRSFINNDYLGLANHHALKKALVDSAEKYGAGSGASHLLGGHSRAHQQLEEELAAFTGRDRALLFSTGYMANLGVMTALLGKGDCILQDKLNHASLIDGGLASGADFRRYLHADASSLGKHLLRTAGKKTLVATDGVFSMDGDIAPLPALATLCKKHDALLMVDDAHGFGVLGKTGAGSCEHFSLTQKDVPVLMGTFGKALGSFGAFVAGSHDMIDMLIQFARTFVYTTAIPPAQAAATSAALRLLNTENWRREKLQSNIDFFRQQAQQHSLPLMDSPTAIQPLLIGSSAKVLRIDEQLRTHGFLVGAVRPPTVAEGAARLRITLSATHDEKNITQLLDTIAETLQALA
ncbi:MAG TPA: 8-amino-7-oxononanoate synthase [Pseudomonadales bacterium]|nr:8-amino-7-oxononanoate synthase [Pseudomonadales bacterium]